MAPPFVLDPPAEPTDSPVFIVHVPPDSPLFAGHFPGHPILPGISHLAWVEAALAGRGGAAPPLSSLSSISSISGVRWRRPASPGEGLALRLMPSEDGESGRFSVVRGEDVLSQGSVGWSAGQPDLPGPLEPLPLSGAWPHPGGLLPHAPPALLLDGILGRSAESLTARLSIPAEHPLVRPGGAPAFLALEAGAQAAALFEALERPEGERRPRLGYLVGIRTARLTVRNLPAARPLAVTARLSASAPPLSIYEVECTAGGRALVSGILSTFLASEEPAA